MLLTVFCPQHIFFLKKPFSLGYLYCRILPKLRFFYSYCVTWLFSNYIFFFDRFDLFFLLGQTVHGAKDHWSSSWHRSEIYLKKYWKRYYKLYCLDFFICFAFLYHNDEQVIKICFYFVSKSLKFSFLLTLQVKYFKNARA